MILQVDTVDGKHVSKNVQACTLDNPTKKLIELIFSNDMFKEAMECMNLGGCASVYQPFNTNRFVQSSPKFSVPK